MPLPTNTTPSADIALLDADNLGSGTADASSYPSIAEFAGDIRYIDFVPVSQRRSGIEEAPGAFPVAYLGLAEGAAVPAHSLMVARSPHEALVAASVLEWYAFLNSGSRDAQSDSCYALTKIIQLLERAEGVDQEQLAAVIDAHDNIIERTKKVR